MLDVCLSSSTLSEDPGLPLLPLLLPPCATMRHHMPPHATICHHADSVFCRRLRQQPTPRPQPTPRSRERRRYALRLPNSRRCHGGVMEVSYL